MSYAHLSQEERYQIQWLRKGGWSLEAIAVELQRAASTISRELRRNPTPEGAYDSRHAQRQAVQRRHAASALPRVDAQTWALVEARLRDDWSPEQIAGAGDVTISVERVYQHVAADRQRGGTLWRHLRQRKRRRRHRCGTPRERQRFGGRRIHERPAIVERRGRVGDWEGDTIVGKGPARVVTLVDRKSGWVRLRKVPDGSAAAVAEAVLAILYPVRARVHTLTWDNVLTVESSSDPWVQASEAVQDVLYSPHPLLSRAAHGLPRSRRSPDLTIMNTRSGIRPRPYLKQHGVPWKARTLSTGS